MDNKKKYSIFRMRNGGGGNRVIFPETHADAVHTTENRKFVTKTQLETIDSLTGSPLLDYNSEEQKTKFNKVLELADNARNIQLLMNNLSIDDIKELQSQMDILKPLLSTTTITSLLALLNQTGKYDLAVVPGTEGDYYTLSVVKEIGEDGTETFKEVYTPYEPSTTNPLLGSMYTPTSYEAETIWDVPIGAENIKLQIPLTEGILVIDNSIDTNVKLWTTLQENTENLTVETITDESFAQDTKTCPSVLNAKPYLWMVWNLRKYLEPILKTLYKKEDIENEYQTIITNIMNFEEKVGYMPIDATSVVRYQPYINQNFYSAHVEENGDNTMLITQEISPTDVNMSYNAINVDSLLNNSSSTATDTLTKYDTVASILMCSEQGSFEFTKPTLTIEIANPFVGKKLKSIKANDHFDLADWEIVNED